MSEDLNIFYYGGSGGFYFLHQLLLSKRGVCFFEDKINFDIARQHNFGNINNPEEWTKHESWPDNEKTFATKLKKPKIFFCVNNIDKWFDYPGKKILVYTDIRSQIRLSRYKKSWIFYDKKKRCNSINDIKNLIKDNKNNMLSAANDAQQYADISVKFQDLLNVNSLTNILSSLDCVVTQENINFLNHYLSLHPKKLLEKIGVEDV